MIHVTLLCVGRLKEPYLLSAVAEYEKRLTAFCRLKIKELPEGNPVVDSLPDGDYLVALCIEGQTCDSPSFSARLAELPLSGRSSVCFVIGGSDGLPDAVKQKAHWKLSFSPMTFPHHLARVMLLEQLYRAFQIQSGGKYHK